MANDKNQALPAGTLLQGGEYRIVGELGRGGFGITYEAEQESLSRKVAIKEFFYKGICQRAGDSRQVLVPVSANEDLVLRLRNKFHSEARKVASLKNDHIVSVHGFFEENGTSYIVMEYLDGGTVEKQVEKGPLAEKDALKVIRDISDALESIHSCDLLHLDIKPGNIMYDKDGRAILIDFGISKYMVSDTDSKTISMLLGLTPGYAPIEQVSKDVESLSPATDVYALGATLFKMLTGKTPPPVSDLRKQEFLAEELEEKGVSAQTVEAIRQAMSLHAGDRPQSVSAFLALLETSEKRDEDVDKAKDPLPEGQPDPESGQDSSSAPDSDADQNPPPHSGILAWISGFVTTLILLAVVLWGYSKLFPIPEDVTGSAAHFYRRAMRGNAKAQNMLGMLYAQGIGVAEDDSLAVIWYRKAAEQGLAEAQHYLGYHYEHGNGVPKDTTEAVKWYKMAANQGDCGAQHRLGHCYENGVGVPQDYTEAAEYFRLSAEQGLSSAQKDLGCLYLDGQGVPQDYSEAVKWFRMAAEKGNSDAQYYLGYCYAEGQGVPRDYSEAVKWYRKSADQNDADAQNQLGSLYYEGKGVPEDDTEAVKWYRMAADQGLAVAQRNLGLCFEDGCGVPKDVKEAERLYRLALENGFTEAEQDLKRLTGE